MKMSKAKVNRLKKKIIDLSIEFTENIGKKQYMRELHKNAKFSADSKNLKKIHGEYKNLQTYFLEPNQIRINNIKPVLINVDGDVQWEKIFRIVRHTWSMPYSKGYGRRLRYIVFDEYHESVIGIIGLQSPPADLKCRDELFNYPDGSKLSIVNQTMDIFSLGSVPPYSGILGGKLVAGLAASKLIQDDFRHKYHDRKTLLNDSVLSSQLIALTTTSAFGRSSIYNRLKFNNRLIAEPIGYTQGYGNIHLEVVYPEIVELLTAEDKLHNGGFGKGPKSRWQNLTRAMSILGLNQTYFRHGLKREVFLFRLVENLEGYIAENEESDKKPTSLALNSSSYAEFWKQRWAMPRSIRKPEWQNLSTNDYFEQALLGQCQD